jgi:hypothetical protein
MKKLLILLAGGIFLTACNGGGGGSGSSNPTPSPTPSATISPDSVDPYPYPTPSTFPTMPNGFATALPSFVTWSTSSNYGLQIAYGHNTNPAAPSLVAFVNQLVTSYVYPLDPANNGWYICSATPVASDGSGGTWLVGAAHCFLSSKSQRTTVSVSDILPPTNLRIKQGVYGSIAVAESAQVFIRKDYCRGSTFDYLGACPNFGPGGITQGNDIALIHIAAKFNSTEIYPRLAESSEYPESYTMAPVLSMGYGDNNVVGGNGDMFYVVNYFYQQEDNLGYHYLLNSYFNPYAGYSALICGGDSGGPDLYWNGSQWLLLSEHTYGPSDADACGAYYSGLPNGATNVLFLADESH